MTRTEVRDLIESAKNAVRQSYPFNSGRVTEFNSNRTNTYPFFWLESLSTETDFTTTQMPLDDWSVVIHIADKDAIDSVPEQYEAIVDACDLLAQKFVYQLNQVVSGYKTLTMSVASREPFIKKHADCTTGVILSFTLTVPDKTDVC